MFEVIDISAKLARAQKAANAENFELANALGDEISEVFIACLSSAEQEVLAYYGLNDTPN